MPTYQYPAVYVTEVAAQVRPIEGVPTSTAALLGPDCLAHLRARTADGYDYQSILAKVDCPLLFLRGETRLGAVMTDDEMSWLQTNFGNAQCARIDGVGHLLHLQEEGQTPVLTAMRAFLEGVHSAAAEGSRWSKRHD